MAPALRINGKPSNVGLGRHLTGTLPGVVRRSVRPCERVEVDEIWSFIYAKNKNVEKAKNPPRGTGDVWT